MIAPAPAGLHLRLVEAGDEAFLRALYRSIRDPELALTGWDEATKQAFADQQFEHQDRWYRQHYAGARFLVIEREGEAIGRLYLHERPRELRVMDIALVPAARNRGLGSGLLAWLQRSAAAEGRDVTLYVETFNPVRALYARLGFAEEDADGLYLRMRWTAPGLHAVEDRLDDPAGGVVRAHE